MEVLMNKARFGVIGLLALLLYGSNALASAYARELAIISNRDYPANTITAATVKDIYLGEKMAEGSVKVKPMESKDETTKKKFIEKIMGSTVDGYKAYWIKKFFQEGVTPPTSKGSPVEMIQAVSQTGGSVGYVWADEVKGDSGVKVLLKIEVGN
jgi:ABC-type phosphate transport system substrate-binding protein